MDDKVMMVIPSYVSKFKCIGGECEDNCCIGWDIDIDKLTFRKLHKIQEEPYKKMFQKSININNECINEALDYGRIKLNKEKRCPFLKENNYCKVQEHFGVDYLSSVCTQFPRVLNKIDDYYEISLDLACPEAARIILGNKDKVTFIKENKSLGKYTMAGILETQNKEFKESPIKYFKEIRKFVLKIIQERNLSLREKLYVLGDFLYNLEDVEINNIPKFLREYNIIKHGKEFENNDINYALSISFLKNAVDSLDIIDEIDSERFREFTKEALNGYNIKNNKDIVDNSNKYINAYKEYEDKFINKYSYIFENYFIVFIINNLFPFSESDFVFDGYIMLLFRFALIRFYLVGIYLNNGKDSYNDIIDFIQVFAKAFEHDRNYRSEILEYLKENDFDNMEFAKMII